MTPGFWILLPPYWIPPPLLLISAAPGVFGFSEIPKSLPPYWDFTLYLRVWSIFVGFPMLGILPPYWIPPPPTANSGATWRFRILENPGNPPPLLVSPPLEDPARVQYHGLRVGARTPTP